MIFQGPKESIDFGTLHQELVSIIGPQGEPQKWFLNGSDGQVEFVIVDQTLNISAVSGIVNSHINNVAQRRTEERRKKALENIEEAKSKARLKYLGVTPGEMETKMLKLSEARAYKRDGYPFDAIIDYPIVKEETEMAVSAPTEDDYKQTADYIISSVGDLLRTISRIDKLEKAAKESINSGSSAQDIENKEKELTEQFSAI